MRKLIITLAVGMAVLGATAAMAVPSLTSGGEPPWDEGDVLAQDSITVDVEEDDDPDPGEPGPGEPPEDPDPEPDEDDTDVVPFSLEECLTDLSDLAADGTHTQDICILATLGHITGYADGTFQPENDVTRGEAATILARVLDLDTDGTADFPDVPEGSAHSGAIAALVDISVIEGLDDGTFGLNQPITRAQAASIIARALELDTTGTPDFPDVSEDSVHAGAIAALVEIGGIEGYDDGTFGPEDNITRGQYSSIIVRSFELDDEVELED